MYVMDFTSELVNVAD